jgi:hypothetical protein
VGDKALKVSPPQESPCGVLEVGKARVSVSFTCKKQDMGSLLQALDPPLDLFNTWVSQRDTAPLARAEREIIKEFLLWVFGARTSP